MTVAPARSNLQVVTWARRRSTTSIAAPRPKRSTSRMPTASRRSNDSGFTAAMIQSTLSRRGCCSEPRPALKESWRIQIRSYRPCMDSCDNSTSTHAIRSPSWTITSLDEHEMGADITRLPLPAYPRGASASPKASNIRRSTDVQDAAPKLCLLPEPPLEARAATGSVISADIDIERTRPKLCLLPESVGVLVTPS